MPKSIIEAVKMGMWDFEPHEAPPNDYERTGAMPGTKAKLHVLAERIRLGLPLWHPEDRDEVDEVEFKREMARQELAREQEEMLGLPRRPR